MKYMEQSIDVKKVREKIKKTLKTWEKNIKRFKT